jgi:hypothetical protein
MFSSHEKIDKNQHRIVGFEVFTAVKIWIVDVCEDGAVSSSETFVATYKTTRRIILKKTKSNSN